ncbi:beta-N-acetylhexosaminidase [Saccharopolyspora taberi]|uniref:beta-N-acetylhexosaminidase n=1 Tax=Saccharopolyspora taberi TaxID=60895 RepID=A0ABN3VGV5_9PSEU
MSFDALLPKPLHVEPGDGVHVLGPGTTVGGEPGVVAWFRRNIGAATGFAFGPGVPAAIEFRVGGVPEGYRIDIGRERVSVLAHDAAAAHHAAQTLRQLLGPDAHRTAPIHSAAWTLPCGVVTDRPRFGWRGCHLDVARHFLPKREVFRFVELMAAHKLNVLHLHLTDDQGWRIEVPRYPKLTEIGAWRWRSMVGRGEVDAFDDRPHGGYYTTDDLREIVAHAAAHHITVVPEVDVPGHSQAAIAAYPELGPGPRLEVWDRWGVNETVLNAQPATVDFYRDVLDHVMDVFPSPVICVGGDEVPTAQWERDSADRAAELGLAHPAHLHGWFLRQVIEHVHANGRQALGWDEILDAGGPLPAGTIVASWRGEEGALRAIEAGHQAVLCPEQHLYFDHRQSDHPDEPIPVGFLRTLDDVHGYEPPAADEVLGVQAQVWTEHLDTPRRVDYAVFPRLAAFAEVAWTEDRHTGFRDRLEHHLARLAALGVEYRPLDGPLPWQTRPRVAGRPR